MELKTKVTHPEHGVGVVENTKEQGTFILVDYKGITYWSHKSQLKPFKGNSYHKKESCGELLHMLAVEVQKVHQYAQDTAKELESGRCTLNMQMQANVHKLYEKKLNDILNNKG
jgi:hypothetical protein